MTIKQMAKQFKSGVTLDIQKSLDDLSGVATLPALHADFLMKHVSAGYPFTRLLDVMADAVKKAVAKGVSAASYPVEIAADGTMFLQSDETVIKESPTLDLSNFGGNRLGVAVVCNRVNPLGFRVLVGPFFELNNQVNEAVRQR